MKWSMGSMAGDYLSVGAMQNCSETQPPSDPFNTEASFPRTKSTERVNLIIYLCLEQWLLTFWIWHPMGYYSKKQSPAILLVKQIFSFYLQEV